jgi:hypothetical protein
MIHIETKVEPIPGTFRTRYLVRVLDSKDNVITAASVVDEDLKVAGKIAVQQLRRIMLDAEQLLSKAGLL